MPHSLRRPAPLAWLLLLCAAAVPASIRAQADTVTGRVASDSARPIPGATVYVTRSSDRAVEQRTTDADGRYTVIFADGSGDYLVYASAAGFSAARKRVQRGGTERRLVADLVLRTVNPTQLAAVRVRAQPPQPPPKRVRLGAEEAGGSEKWAEGVAGAVAPNARGDLGATALTTTGFTAGANGLSLLGAGGALTTLNGAAIPGLQLPRAANLDARFTGTTFDATRGGFSGANFDVQLGPGNRDFQQKNAFVTLDAPAFTVTDATGRALGLPVSGGRASFGADGELVRRTVTYNVAADVTRNASTPASLLTADDATLALAGVSPANAAALQTAATSAGLPLGLAGANRVRDNLTVLARFDDTRDTARTRAISALASAERRRGLGLAPALAPSATAEQLDLSGSLQLLLQRYVGADRRLFAETRASATLVRATGEPTTRLPAAAVLLGTGASLDPTALGTATLGGDASALRDQTRWIAEAAQELTWLPTFSNRHTLKGALWARADGLRDASQGNAFGTLLYNSLADLAANRPAAYSRLLSQPVRDGAVLNAAGAVSYRWNPGPAFQLIGGARLETNASLTTPRANPALASALGIDNAATPFRLHLSPRLGFTWRPGARGTSLGINQSNMGTFVRQGSGALRVGVGEFRDLLRPELLAGAAGATGIAGSTLGLTCVGAAVPTPQWAQGEFAMPGTCVGGAGPQALQAGAVQFIDPSFDVPRSWRASVGWSQDIRPFILRLEGLAAVNLNQPSRVDANFAGAPTFVLGDDGRPMFVPATGIDAATGAVNLAGSRRTTTFGVVRGLRSDGRSQGGQLSATLLLDQWATEGNVFASVSYTWQSLRQRFRGFEGAGVGDPFRWEWARAADDARHTVLASFGAPIRRGNRQYGTFTFFTRLQSGLPFTPIVQGDLDGDGTGGDRAFLGAATVGGLAQSGPAWVQRCLTAQLGRIAGRHSCEGPWAVSTNAQLDIDPASRLLGRRITMSVNLSNPLALADQLLHGERNLRGWGGPALPDPVLLVPRGFSPATNTFTYAVNPRFGDTRPGRTLLRNPFQLALDFSIDLTRNPDVQQLERNIEPAGRGAFTRPPADTILARYMERVSSIHQALLDNADTLFLTRPQIEESLKADTAFREAARAAYRPLAEYLASLPRRFDGLEAKAKVDSAERRYQELFWQQRDLAKARLQPLQASALPRWIQAMFATRLDDDWERWPRYVFRRGSVSVSRR